MNVPAHPFVFSLLLLGIGGCATGPQTPVVQVESEETKQQAVAVVADRMDQAVLAARRGGPEAESYLATELFLKGNAALLEGDHATAAIFLRPLTALTEDIFIHKKYAAALIRQGEMVEAVAVLEGVWKRTHEDETVGLLLAGVYGAAERPRDAERLYRALLARNPSQVDACLFLGKLMVEDKKYAEGEKHLRACQLRHPKEGLFSYHLGKMHVQRENLPAALRAFEESQRRDPSFAPAANAVGMIYEQFEKPLQALAAYERYLQHNPHDASVLARLVQLMFVLEKHAEVLPYAERLVDLEVEDLNMRLKLGILYTDAKEYDKAVSVFRELLARAPESDKILYYLGAIHQEQRKYEAAIDFFARIPTESGLFSDSSFQVASMLAGLAQAEHARDGKAGPLEARFQAALTRAREAVPKLKVELAVLEAGHLEALESDEEAATTLQAVPGEAEFGPQHQYYFASLLEKVQRHDEAARVIRALLEKEPKNAHAWNFLGYAMLERATPALARPYIEKAVELAPDDGYIRDSLGWYYYKTGNHARALRELQFAFRKVPQDVVVAKHLAILHRERREFAKARIYLEHALKNVRHSTERREIAEAMRDLETVERVPASAR